MGQRLNNSGQQCAGAAALPAVAVRVAASARVARYEDLSKTDCSTATASRTHSGTARFRVPNKP
jgi:hypothetical protein